MIVEAFGLNTMNQLNGRGDIEPDLPNRLAEWPPVTQQQFGTRDDHEQCQSVREMRGEAKRELAPMSANSSPTP
ncbi:hypothetical protein OG407_49520 [Streptomyces sp. NBC_01515]|uniref:hypothetical protein n=1 Tax=Streptomyces sp. NBC_01515 TaxID=2903890 RepID=UPI0038657312